MSEDKPLENIKPQRGMLVRLEGQAGVWQVQDKAPRAEGVGAFWLWPWDDAARDCVPHPQHGRYRCATYRDMRKVAR